MLQIETIGSRNGKTTTKVLVPFVVVLTVEASVSLLGKLVGEGLNLGA